MLAGNANISKHQSQGGFETTSQNIQQVWSDVWSMSEQDYSKVLELKVQKTL